MNTKRLASFALGLTIAIATVAAAQDSVPEYIDPQQTPPAAATQTRSAPPSKRKLALEIDVAGGRQWTDTGIAIVPGDRVSITATGTVQTATMQSVGPEGLARDWHDLLRALPVNGAGSCALIGRIGDSAATVPFMIGSSKQMTVNTAGHLFLGINQLGTEQSSGSFHARITITPAEKPAGPPATLSFPAEFFTRIPRRVTDANENPGDLVNFIVIGSEERLMAAFQNAGWVKVDRTKAEAVLHAVFSSTSKEAYLEMPMSELYLFGRVQDYGFARAEPVQVVTTRHHLRVWKVPFQYEGKTVWAGAATHDIGFEKDQRTGGVTHKIDPNVDVEREFVGQCFSQAGALSGMAYATPSDLVRDAHTATGGTIQSDGRVLVLMLTP